MNNIASLDMQEYAALLDVAPAPDMTLDQLDYMIDLISELREMAQRSRLEPLSNILALAQTEAAREAALRRR